MVNFEAESLINSKSIFILSHTRCYSICDANVLGENFKKNNSAGITRCLALPVLFFAWPRIQELLRVLSLIWK